MLLIVFSSQLKYVVVIFVSIVISESSVMKFEPTKASEKKRK